MRRLARRLAPLAVVALVTTACSGGLFGDDQVRASAVFDDVVDLVPRGSVRMNDLTVGSIDRIELTEDHRARVHFRVDADAPVPANVLPTLAKTSVLGERYVDLVVQGEPSGELTDGREFDVTGMRTDLEDLVATGSDLLALISADQVRTTLQTAAEAFGGRASLISGFVDDVNGALSTFDDNTDDLVDLVDALDRVTAAYAPNAGENAAVLADLREAAAVLQEQDEQLLDTLDDATLLATEATDFLSEHQDETENFVRRLRKLLDQLVEAEVDLRDIFLFTPRQFLFVPLAEINFETVVWLDVILCGINDTDGDPSRDCTPPNPGERAPSPPYYPVREECFEDPTPCQQEAREDG